MEYSDEVVNAAINNWNTEIAKATMGRNMRSKITSREGRVAIDSRRERQKEILQVARGACRRLGGLAIINDRYSVVDTKYYNITQKEKANGT